MKQNPSAQDHGIRGRKRLETAQHSLQTGVYPTAVVFAAQAESDLFDAGDADAAGEAMAIRRQALRSLGAKQNPGEEILNMKQNPVTRAPNRTARPAPKGHYYKVLDKKGRVIAFTTTKAEAESVCPAGGRVQHL